MSGVKTEINLRNASLFGEVLKHSRLNKVSSLFERQRSVKVHSFVLSLHSTATVAILMLSMVFVGMRQYFGEPIECLNNLSGTNSITKPQMQRYCWMEGAFTVVNPGYSEKTDQAYPGVEPDSPDAGLHLHHKYYQWVYYILCIQAVSFYLPKYFWRVREDERLKTLISKLKNCHILGFSATERHKIVQDTFDIIMTSGGYFWSLMACEILSFLNLALNVWFLNLILGDKFLSLGLDWLTYNHSSTTNLTDPLIKVFPRVVKCNFHKYGPSGSLETIDTLCFLWLNTVNEKIFVILWFWFIVLLTFNSVHLFSYRIPTIMIPFIRFGILKSYAPTADKIFLRRLCRKVGNWFVLQLIASHVRPYYFCHLLDSLAEEYWDKNTDGFLIRKVSQKVEVDDSGPLVNNFSPKFGGHSSKDDSKENKKYDEYELTEELETW